MSKIMEFETQKDIDLLYMEITEIINLKGVNKSKFPNLNKFQEVLLIKVTN